MLLLLLLVVLRGWVSLQLVRTAGVDFPVDVSVWTDCSKHEIVIILELLFLNALSSRKRKAIRKEREKANSAGVKISTLVGADITARHSVLHGIDVPPDVAPSMIDEFPVFFVAASMAQGRTTTSGLD